MDLSFIQTHISNFVDTIEGWGNIGKAFGKDGVFSMLKTALDNLKDVSSSTFFPNTEKVIKPEGAAE